MNLLDIFMWSKELETVWLVVGVAVPVGGPVLVWGSWHLVNRSLTQMICVKIQSMIGLTRKITH